MPGFDVAFANLLRARFPYVYVRTWEEERVLALIRSIARDADLIRTTRSVFTWSVTEGMVGPGMPAKEKSHAPLDALSLVERHAEPAIFVFKDFHVFFGMEKGEQDHCRSERCRWSWKRTSPCLSSTCRAWPRSAKCCAA